MSVIDELAGELSATRLLLGMGLRCFSMHPGRISAVKQRVLRADTRGLAESLAGVLAAADPEQAMARAVAARQTR